MAIRQKGSSWQVDVTVAGTRAPRVSCATKAEALRVEADFRAKLLAGVPADSLAPSTPTRTARAGTLDDLLTITHRSVWVGTKAEDTALRNAMEWTKELGAEFPVADVTGAVISDVVDSWAAAGSSNGTINRKLAALSVMLRVAEEREMIEKRPKLPRRKEYEGRLRYFTDAEVDSLLHHVQWNGPMFRLFTVAVGTGMRLGELQAMIVRDLDFDAKRVDLGATKGNKRRSVPMTEEVARVLKIQTLGLADHERVFPEYLNSRNISRIMAEWKRERKLPPNDEACFHTFRHTTCSRLMMAGVPINVVMKFMGHARIETTMRYAHLAPDSLDLARNALERTAA